MNLVTGATGMVGAYLTLELLKNNEKVVAIYKTEASITKTKSLFQVVEKDYLFENIIWEKSDITDVFALTELFNKHQFENIYHCAALISFVPKEFEAMIKINVEGTANMVNFALSNQCQSFCYVSSIAALGDLENEKTIITESENWNKEIFHSDYAISKYGAEIEVRRAQQEGLNVVIVNPGVILGAGFWDTGSGAIFSNIKKRSLFFTKGITGFVAVEDLVKIMFQLIQKKCFGENYIVVSENISFQKLIQMITQNFGLKKPKYYINPLITNMIYRIDSLIVFLFFTSRKFTKSIHLSLHSESFYDHSKVKKELNFEFEPIDITIFRIGKLFEKNI